MDNRESFLGKRSKVGVSASVHAEDNKSKRLGKYNGSIIHVGSKHNRSTMGEIAIGFVNGLGIMVFIAGILANMDNSVSVLLGVIAAAFGIMKVFYAYEGWRMKRIDRKEKEDAYNHKTKN